mmetsp:Transcript_27068/g.80003  ORF Transcript_27068/g.80003 Transcript_27068/m.80003 type:complete len:206 (+) Transcript_27068:847-1464(+)
MLLARVGRSCIWVAISALTSAILAFSFCRTSKLPMAGSTNGPSVPLRGEKLFIMEGSESVLCAAAAFLLYALREYTNFSKFPLPYDDLTSERSSLASSGVNQFGITTARPASNSSIVPGGSMLLREAVPSSIAAAAMLTAWRQAASALNPAIDATIACRRESDDDSSGDEFGCRTLRDTDKTSSLSDDIFRSSCPFATDKIPCLC